LSHERLTPIAFYLPQFHPTPFNDKHWSPGFTEWTNVAQGRPRFQDHKQPKIPGEIGFYDLRYRPIFEQQVTLAQAHGIFGFCFYYYRFGGSRELDLPIRSLLAAPSPNLPFCLCWANESWTRAWDGQSNEIIREQTYNEDTMEGLLEDLSLAMLDSRYIRVNSEPVFLIYQLEQMPSPLSKWISSFRSRLRERIGVNIILGAVYSHKFTTTMALEVDFVVQFPPHRLPRKERRKLVPAETVGPFDLGRNDYFESYEDVIESSLSGIDIIPNLVPGVCPDWDNSVRRSSNAHILIGSTPERFGSWVRAASNVSVKKAEERKIPHPFLFINAWNEWGEGAMLEPSLADGRKYLEAFLEGSRKRTSE
jgi:lipopolysaccharide biosynthesis protein